MSRLRPPAAAAPPQVDEPALRAVRPLAAPATCPRYLMRGAPRELRTPRGAADAFFGGLVIVTEDSLGVGRAVCSLLAEQGAHAFLIQRSDLLDPERLERRVMSLLYLHGSLRGVVHLAALGIPAACDNLDAWRDATALTTKSFFRILQLCALGFESASEPVQILAATQLGGAWGRATPGMVGTAAAGSVHGMLRTLESEYPKVLGKVVDFDAALAPSLMAQHIVDELLADDGSYEIGYPGGQRSQFLATRTPLAATAPHAWRPQAGWVVLVNRRCARHHRGDLSRAGAARRASDHSRPSDARRRRSAGRHGRRNARNRPGDAAQPVDRRAARPGRGTHAG
jgi:hypothetical protein